MTDRSIALFVSPHGFGHAARACAIIGELNRRLPAVAIHVFTRVPEWFFAESLPFPFFYHELETDVGMVQLSPLREDVVATARKLDSFLDFSAGRIEAIASMIRAVRCGLVVCDIAPLGIAVAAHCGLPSVLIENFTWDWIYDGYAAAEPRMAAHAATVRAVFASATHRIQTEPVTVRHPADLVTAPVSRPCRAAIADTRAALGVGSGDTFVLVSMGGVATQRSFLDTLGRHSHCLFAVPADGVTAIERRGSVILLPWHASLYHPDLVAAADVVVGKLGYSTIAEVFNAGVAFGYFTRPEFRESWPLQTFVDAHVPSVRLADASFDSGGWLQAITHLLAVPRVTRTERNGAMTAADWLCATFFG